MGRLTVSKTKSGISVTGEVSIFKYEEDGIHYCVSPELDIVGYDYTAEKAEESFKLQLESFFEYASKKNCLSSELKRLGWNTDKSKFESPSINTLATSNELFTELLEKNNFVKSQTPVAYC
jgi:hypothetical protein